MRFTGMSSSAHREICAYSQARTPKAIARSQAGLRVIMFLWESFSHDYTTTSGRYIITYIQHQLNYSDTHKPPALRATALFLRKATVDVRVRSQHVFGCMFAEELVCGIARDMFG